MISRLTTVIIRVTFLGAFLIASTLHAQVIPNRGMQAGNGNWMEIPDNASIAIPVFTVEVWVKSSSGGLIVTRDVPSGIPSDWQLWYDFSRKRLAFITAKTPPDSYFFTPDNSFLPNRWYHVALVVNGPAGRAKLYIDGTLTISPTFSSRYFSATTGLAWCGYYNNAGGAYLNGVIDEARYWNVERTEKQINDTKDIDLPANDRNGLVGWWRFCDSYEDYSGAGNHGTPRGNPQLVLISLPFGITCSEDPCDSLEVDIIGDSLICQGDSTTLTASPGFASYRWSTGDTTRSIRAAAAGTYTVVVSDTSGCHASASIIVSFHPQPTANAGPDIVLCRGGAAVIGRGPQRPEWTYQWLPPIALSAPDSAVTRVTGGISRTYILRVTTENGCIDQDTVLVTVRDGLQLSLPDSLHMCPGSNAVLPLTVVDGIPPLRFTWSPSSTLNAADVQNPVAMPSATQWYHVHVTDSMGCEGEDSILVVVTDGLDTDLPPVLRICSGSSVLLPLQVLNGTPTYTFQWEPAEGLDRTDVKQPVAAPDSSRWYFVTVRDSAGCEGRDSVLVEVMDELETALPDTLFVCPLESVVLPLTVSNGSGSLQFDWSPEADLSNPHARQPVARPKETTTWHVHVFDSLGCEAWDSVTVVVHTPAAVRIVLDGPSRFCIGDSVRLTATPGFRSYRWNTPTRVIPDTGNTIIAREAGRYYVTVIDSNGCEAVSTPVTITTFPAFDIEVILRGPQPMCPGDSVILEAEEGYSDYVWTDDSGHVVGTGRTIGMHAAGRYTVVARDSSGCAGDSDPVDVTVAEKPEAEITGPRMVCISSIHTYVSQYNSHWEYEWSCSGGTIVSSATDRSVQVHWFRTGRFTLMLHIRDTRTGCADTVSLLVDVIAGIHPDIQSDGPIVFCEGDSVLLRSRDVHDLAIWKDSSGSILGTGPSLVVRQSGIYYYHASTADSCHGMDSIRITVIPSPEPEILGPVYVCAGDTVNYQLRSDGGTIEWEFSGGTLISGDDQGCTMVWTSAGRYVLRVTETPRTGDPPCPGSDELEIVVHPPPNAWLTASPDTVICDGDSVRLTAPAGNQRYVWSTPSEEVDTTAHELIVRTGGSYFVTVTNAAGCSAVSMPVSITVLPAPAPRIEGPRFVCSNAQTRYTLRDPGNGEWIWTVDGGELISDSADTAIDVQWNDAGTGTVFVRVTNGVCIGMDTMLVTIGDSVRPVITAEGPTRFCRDGEVVLDAGNGYATYTWYTPNGTETGRKLSAHMAGSYRVHVTTETGCDGTSGPIDIVISDPPKPIVRGPEGLCPGDTVMLESPPGYVSYTWSDGTIGRICMVSGAANRTVTVTDSNGCTGTSGVHTVALYGDGPTPEISRNGVMLLSTPARTYQWYRNDTLLTGETSRSCRVTAPGRYMVAVTYDDACPAASSVLDVRCVTSSTVVSLPHIVTEPGAEVNLSIALEEGPCLEAVGAETFAARIRFERSVLVPMDPSLQCRTEGTDRIVEFTGSLRDLREGAPGLRFLATLGTRDSIPLVLDDFTWLDAPVAVTRLDGSLRMRICREGGDRLFDDAGQVRLEQNRPNPFNTSTVIEYETIESGMTELFVLNALGQRVKTLLREFHQPGSYTVRFDAEDLPSGSYICVLRTPTIALQRLMLLVK